MILAVGVDTTDELCSLVGVTSFAVHRRNLVGMRITLDAGMAIAALQAAVNAIAEFFPSTEMLWPAASVMLESPWQVRQSVCARRVRAQAPKWPGRPPALGCELKNRVLSYGLVHSAVFLPPGKKGLITLLAGRQRFHHCCTPEPLPRSGFPFEKKLSYKVLERAHICGTALSQVCNPPRRLKLTFAGFYTPEITLLRGNSQ